MKTFQRSSKKSSLSGDVIVCTGAAGFLVSDIALSLVSLGCKVALLDSNTRGLRKIKNRIGAHKDNCLYFAADVTQKNDYKKCLKKILKKWRRLDGAVLGAGINASTPFLDISLQEWNRILAVQLTGTMLGCQVFGEHMVAQGWGSIITISSASSGPPLSKAFTYSVAKAGVKNLTQNLAREWGDKGVRVNALRPGFFPTEWSKKHFIDKKREKAILSHTPMKRYGNPKELVGAVAWLLSDDASFVTGAEIAVDGGFSCMSI